MALLINKIHWLFVELLLFSSQLPYLANATIIDYSSVKLVQSWDSNIINEPGIWQFADSSIIRPIIVNNSTDFTFGFRFFSTRKSRGFGNEYYLIVFLLTQTLRDHFMFDDSLPPIVLWCANRDNSVSWNSTLNFNEGNLELKGRNGTVVWSTNTTGLDSARLNISTVGNLMVVDDKDTVIWQSFDYPTDTWLLNQTLSFGKILTSRNSSSEMNTGLYSLLVNLQGFYGYVNSNPPQKYIHVSNNLYDSSLDAFTRIEIYLGSRLSWFKLNQTDNFFQFMRLEWNGKLNVYQVRPNSQPFENRYIFASLGECDYPLYCGSYEVCSGSGQCSCAVVNSSYFTPAQYWEPSHRCMPITPLLCNNRHLHSFIELKNVSYFNSESRDSSLDVNSCKKACLEDCTCKAAIFSPGLCSLKSEVYSLKYAPESASSAFIKVQDAATTSKTQDRKKSSSIPVLAIVLPVGIVVTLLLIVGYYYYKVMMNSSSDDDDEDDQVIGGLKRFSFLELKSATGDFQVMLGRGGFGSVFEGTLGNGRKVAVKCLDSVGQGRKEFLAEVNTIGGSNHFNLVRLIGYCSEKSNRLLAYEHMHNGSLDKWIFHGARAKTISWEIRSKIIVGIAKGLEYLHVQCNPNIIHFDIKPQNILLDAYFNAKISDFGLAKMIDRDHSQVFTRVKGTPGYVAPELFRGTDISVKVDVFSFGIVILEIVFGRKNFDSTQSCSLIELVEEKVKNGQVEEDLIDVYNNGIRFPKREAAKMIKTAIWCLQVHYRRPCMTDVLNVLEGLVDLDSVAVYRFIASPIMETRSQVSIAVSTPLVASFLSGPR